MINALLALLGADSSFYRAGLANPHGARPLEMVLGGPRDLPKSRKNVWYCCRPPYSPKSSSSLRTPENWRSLCMTA